MTAPLPGTIDAPILVFDSGIGGLSVLAPILTALPAAPIVYAADFAGLPYGEKSEIEVATRVCALLGRLSERLAPRLIVIACNTASTIALAHVRAVLEVPVVGTVPAIKPAAEMSKTRVIGVLGTAATVRQPYVDRLAAEFAADCTLLRHGAPDLVHAAEAKLRGEAVDPSIYRAAIAGLRNQPGGDAMDVIVLACTHFPLVEAELAAVTGPATRFVHGGDGIARRVARLMADQPWPAQPERRAICTGEPAQHAAYGAALARFGIKRIDAL
jgi:glutamate racemase